jgi:hypothetical protein
MRMVSNPALQIEMHPINIEILSWKLGLWGIERERWGVAATLREIHATRASEDWQDLQRLKRLAQDVDNPDIGLS